jgi:hypothetical protein
MAQDLIVYTLFAGALIYLIVLVRKGFSTSDNGCVKGCGCLDKMKTQALKNKNAV